MIGDRPVVGAVPISLNDANTSIDPR